MLRPEGFMPITIKPLQGQNAVQRVAQYMNRAEELRIIAEDSPEAREMLLRIALSYDSMAAGVTRSD
ncbi:MAG: hypothetical protein JO208_00245 [Alphaproteobacteria bacterium]|nr:hypothetical protein [Alphaproteobacteria bacterium]